MTNKQKLTTSDNMMIAVFWLSLVLAIILATGGWLLTGVGLGISIGLGVISGFAVWMLIILIIIMSGF